MKTLKDILPIGFFFLFFDLQGQELSILNTKDLVNISKEFGLDSAVNITNGIPIYYIDSLTAYEIARQIDKNDYSENIETFLVDFSLHSKYMGLPEIINGFIDKKNQVCN